MGESHLEDPDVQLMLRVRAGDAEAFEELVGAYAPTLIAFMTRFLGAGGAAEDLAQEVFMKVHRAAPGYEPTAKFRTWILTIATNLCLNEQRRESRRFHFSLDAPIEDGGGVSHAANLRDETNMPDVEIERGELRAKVRDAIASLPENQRVAILLARYEQLSYLEIADTMKVSIMAVKSLINRAKTNLKTALAREVRDFLVTDAGEEHEPNRRSLDEHHPR